MSTAIVKGTKFSCLYVEGRSTAILPLERDDGSPTHKLLSQSGEFDLSETFGEQVTKLVIRIDFYQLNLAGTNVLAK